MMYNPMQLYVTKLIPTNGYNIATTGLPISCHMPFLTMRPYTDVYAKKPDQQ